MISSMLALDNTCPVGFPGLITTKALGLEVFLASSIAR